MSIGAISHDAKNAVLYCIDDRFGTAHHRYLIGIGGGFGVSMAGGGFAILTLRDRASAVGQFTDGYGISPFDTFHILVHMGCGKLEALTAPNGELYGYDPESVADLYTLADIATDIVANALFDMYRVHVPGQATVLALQHNEIGLRYAPVIPRPQGVLLSTR